jgi:hypothetical protein
LGVLKNQIVSKVVKKLTAFVGNWLFTAILKRDCSFYLYCARLIFSTPSNSVALQSTLILSSHLVLDLQSDPFPSDVLTKFSYVFIYSYMDTTCPSYLILLDLNTRKIFDVDYKS